MRLVRSIAEMRAALGASRRAGAHVGFVPTMGYLHDGHLSLLTQARAENDVAVVSLFVNPTQFNEPADLAAYPRDEVRDATLAERGGADFLFAPAAAEMYPPGFATTVSVSGLTETLEGAARGAAHFNGVATVVTKLLNIVQPTVAYFGQKDAQQAIVIRRMVRDLDLPVRITVCPTIREHDGLAMSSRNVRLDPGSRGRALALRRGLDAARAAIDAGERDAMRVAARGADTMQALGVAPEYFAVVSAETFAPLPRLAGDVLIAVAARIGDVRLIDNDVVTLPVR